MVTPLNVTGFFSSKLPLSSGCVAIGFNHAGNCGNLDGFGRGLFGFQRFLSSCAAGLGALTLALDDGLGAGVDVGFGADTVDVGVLTRGGVMRDATVGAGVTAACTVGLGNCGVADGID